MSKLINLQDKLDILANQTDALISSVLKDDKFLVLKFSELHCLLDMAQDKTVEIKKINSQISCELDE